jgi:hypothetical protein
MIAPALLSLVALFQPLPANRAPQNSRGIYLASVTGRGGRCSYGVMDVVGLARSALVGSLTDYHTRDPDIGLVIWVGRGTSQRCIQRAQSAARAAGYLDVHILREGER